MITTSVTIAIVVVLIVIIVTNYNSLVRYELIVGADDTITPEEYEFMRLTSMSLGVPMPAMPCA